MARATPSLLALLGLVAVAGYQNRGRISEMLSDARLSDARRGSPDPGPDVLVKPGREGDGGFLTEIGSLFGAGTAGTTLSTGLSELLDRFRSSGRAAPADSWVSAKPNMPINVNELEAAIGTETLDDLGHKTGLSRADLLLRLNTALPEFVDRFTPDGHLPTEAEARNFG